MIISRRLKGFVYVTAAWFAVMAIVHVAIFEPMADGLRTPDSRLAGYSLDDFAAWVAALSADERGAFLFWHTRVLDFVFPFLLMAALFFVLRAVLSAFPRFADMPAIMRTFVPLLIVAPYGMFDMLENGLVADMLRGEIAINAASVGLASAYTMLKWSFLAIAFILTSALWFTVRAKTRTTT